MKPFIQIILGFVVPSLFYIGTQSAHAYFFDAGEFVAGSFLMDVTHPPGHPLAELWGYGFSLLPVGSAAFKVALGQGVALAAMLYVFFQWMTTRVNVWLALLASWMLGLLLPVWFQGIRPEVYALSGLFSVLYLKAFFELVSSDSFESHAWFRLIFWGVLGLCNHHFMLLVLMASTLPWIWVLPKLTGDNVMSTVGKGIKRAWKPTMVLVLFGLVPYLYLWVRSQKNLLMDFGDPSTLGNLFWVVSAKVYQKSVHVSDNHAGSFLQRCSDVFYQFAVHVPFELSLFALAAYVGMRLKKYRLETMMFLSVFLGTFFARVILGFVPRNPDAWGYLIPCYAVVIATAVMCIERLLGLLLNAIKIPKPELGAWLSAALVCVVLMAMHAQQGWAQANLRTFKDTEHFSQNYLNEVPPHSVLFVHAPETYFRVVEELGVSETRPDVVVVPMPFLGYPGVKSNVKKMLPPFWEFRGQRLLENQMFVRELAASRPVLVEMDPEVPEAMYKDMVPMGLYYFVMDGGADSRDMNMGVRRYARDRMQFIANLEKPYERSLEARVLWMSYMDAAFFASLGYKDGAGRAIQFAREVAPDDPNVQRLYDDIRRMAFGVGVKLKPIE